MPIFHFHLALVDRMIRDDEGVERPDLATARQEAIASARDLMSTDVRQGRLQMDQAIHIHDGNDRQLAVVTFHDALSIMPIVCEPARAR